jgi:hypothetical protein
MPRRKDHEVHKDMWWHWIKKKSFLNSIGIETEYMAHVQKKTHITSAINYKWYRMFKSLYIGRRTKIN